MKKTWIALCLAAALALPLGACSSRQTGSSMTVPGAVPSALPERDPGHDLAGANGVVGSDGTGLVGQDDNLAGSRMARSPATDYSGATGKSQYGGTAVGGVDRTLDSSMARAGQEVKDTLNNMGNKAQSMGSGVRMALQ